MTNRRFPPPWTIERLPGGFKFVDANGQSLAYFYARDNDHASIAKVLTMDEARRMAGNFAKLPELLWPRRLEPSGGSISARRRSLANGLIRLIARGRSPLIHSAYTPRENHWPTKAAMLCFCRGPDG